MSAPGRQKAREGSRTPRDSYYVAGSGNHFGPKCIQMRTLHEWPGVFRVSGLGFIGFRASDPP